MNTTTSSTTAILQKRMSRKIWMETVLTIILAACVLLLTI